MRTVNVGILGGGTVGGGVIQGLKRNGSLMRTRTGISLRVSKVAVRDLKKERAVAIPNNLLTADWREVVEDPKVELVAELMGGTGLAKTAVLRALQLGKPVVTANKALLSEHGQEIFAAAEANETNVYFESSVAGGIPIIKALREGMVGNRVVAMQGILNGTCNYILSRMEREGGAFEDILADAQRLGYAEAEPSLDVDGLDAMHKTGLLATLAYGFWVGPESIFVEGIRHITPLDIDFARQLGYKIKLIASVEDLSFRKSKKSHEANAKVSVCPTLVPESHVLAGVSDVFNAVYLKGDVVGETLFYGHGAGQDATASAVLADLADAACELGNSSLNGFRSLIAPSAQGRVVPWEEVVCRYYLRLSVQDRPGVLARIANVLGESKIGISSVFQPEGHEGKAVPLILMVHDAPNKVMHSALQTIGKLKAVKEQPLMIRVANFGGEG